MRTAILIVVPLLTLGRAGADPWGSDQGFAELQGAWIRPVRNYDGVGDGVRLGTRVGFFPSTSVRVAVAAGFDVSCVDHLTCWKSGMIGARYARRISSRLALVAEGLAGLQTVGLHVSRELSGYTGTIDAGFSCRLASFEIGPSVGVTYSFVPSYNADVGPDPSGVMASIGLAARLGW